MKSLILAAGRGTRINEITRNNHKCLIKLQKKPLLKWQINALSECSSKICVVTGYNESKIKETLKQIKNITFVRNKEWKSSNMFYSLLKFEEYCLFISINGYGKILEKLARFLIVSLLYFIDYTLKTKKGFKNYYFFSGFSIKTFLDTFCFFVLGSIPIYLTSILSPIFK